MHLQHYTNFNEKVNKNKHTEGKQKRTHIYYRPVRCGTGATLVHGTADWFPQIAWEGGVREQEAGVGAGPIKVGVVQLFLCLKD